METIHLQHDSGTKCGFKPPWFKTAPTPMGTNCWDCLDAQFHEFDFRDTLTITEFTRKIELVALYKDEIVASLEYNHSGGYVPMLLEVWVSPGFRGRGLCTIIMKKIMTKVGPPIQIKAEPYVKSHEETPGLNESDLRNFYSKLGFVGLTSGKHMLWYPVAKDNIIQVKVENYGNNYMASVVGNPEIKSIGSSHNLAVGNLFYDHNKFFGISFVKENVDEVKI